MYDLELPANVNKSIHRKVNIFEGVGGRELDADTSLTYKISSQDISSTLPNTQTSRLNKHSKAESMFALISRRFLVSQTANN